MYGKSSFSIIPNTFIISSHLYVCVCVLSLRFMLSMAELYYSMPRSLVTSFLLIVFVVIIMIQ